MKKLIFFLLACMAIANAQTIPVYPTVKLSKPTNVTTPNALVTIASDGTLTKTSKVDLLSEVAVPNATTTTLGKIQLAGDLTGTATAPVIANNAITDAKVANGISASKVGLANVDNTSDANKPVSTATQTALNFKSDKKAIVEDINTYSSVPTLTEQIISTLVIPANTFKNWDLIRLNAYLKGISGTASTQYFTVYINTNNTLTGAISLGIHTMNNIAYYINSEYTLKNNMLIGQSLTSISIITNGPVIHSTEIRASIDLTVDNYIIVTYIAGDITRSLTQEYISIKKTN